MSTHDFHDEGTLVRISGTGDGVDAFDDTVQSRISTNRHVRTTKIVVDGTHQSDDVQVLVLVALLLCDFP